MVSFYFNVQNDTNFVFDTLHTFFVNTSGLEQKMETDYFGTLVPFFMSSINNFLFTFQTTVLVLSPIFYFLFFTLLAFCPCYNRSKKFLIVVNSTLHDLCDVVDLALLVRKLFPLVGVVFYLGRNKA
jgi:hypothetical protein